jgi:ATP-dependent DNA helicase RecG
MTTLGDMLYYFPRRYDDYSQLKPIKELFYGEQVTVIGTIQSVHSRPIRGGKASIIEVIISDGTGGLRLRISTSPGWRTVSSRAMPFPSRAGSTSISDASS